MISKDEIIVIIPIYKTIFTNYEIISLKQTLSVLKQYPISFIIPRKLKDQQIGFPFFDNQLTISSIYFDDFYFSSIAGYNKLLLTKEFYKVFEHFKYMAICQLDVFIIKDTLINWAEKGFDYIGAPWSKTDADILFKYVSYGKHFRIIRYLVKFNKFFFGKKDYLIGNGGLSLRNIRHCITALKFLTNVIKKFDVNEDVIWSIVVPVFYPFFRVPNLVEGLGFAIEKDIQFYLKLNNDISPFGYHALEKYYPEIWKTVANEAN